MDIYADPGHKVRYLGENGYDYERTKVESEGVKIDDVLTVEDIDVGDWKTRVKFEEISGWHNSVMFEDVQ